MRTGNTKIFLLVLCLAVCVGMCRSRDVVVAEDTNAPAPAPGNDATSGSFVQWVYDSFGYKKDGEQQQLQAGAPAPAPTSDYASKMASDAKELFDYGKDKASNAYDEYAPNAVDKVGEAYESAKKTVNEETKTK